MPRVTIHLTDQMYRALVEAAAQERCSMDSIVEESLKLGISRRSSDDEDVLAHAQSSSALSDEEAMAVAVREVQLHRAARLRLGKAVPQVRVLHSTRDPSQRATCQKGRTHDL